MDSMSYILFICIAVPLGMMLIPIEKQSRKIVVALLMGMFLCLFVSEVNGLLLRLTKSTMLYLTTNVTPITEEFVKVLPVIYYAYVFSDDEKSVTTVAFATGVGFAMLENIIILMQHLASANFIFAMIRGFSTGLMHSITTMLVANFVPYIHKKKKLFLCGVLCSFNLAVVFHSVFNLLVEAESTAANYIGYFLPVSIYMVINVFVLKKFVKKSKSNGSDQGGENLA